MILLLIRMAMTDNDTDKGNANGNDKVNENGNDKGNENGMTK